MPPKVDHDKCNGSGDCYDGCPAEPKVYEIREGKAHVVSPDSCIHCGACEVSCPYGAITLE